MATTLTTQAPTVPELRRRRALRDSAWPWVLPLALVLALVLVYPLVEVLRLSFTDASLVSGEPYSATTGTYRSLARGDDFRHTLQITFLFVLFSTVFQLALGLAAGLLVNGAERRGGRGAGLTRTPPGSARGVPGGLLGGVLGPL